MLTSAYSGNKILSYIGARSFSNGPTYSIVEVEESDPNTACSTRIVWELYLINNSRICIDEDAKAFVCTFKPNLGTESWKEQARALRYLIQVAKYYRNDITAETIKKLRDFYNDYYKYESWFEEI